MEKVDEKSEASAGRPFHLRPSILSGGGSGISNPFLTSGTTAPLSAPKGFVLRPSALSAAADKLEAHATESRKRIHPPEPESPEKGDCKKTFAGSVESGEPDRQRLKLIDELEKPTGIGTFGFADKTNTGSTRAGEEKETKAEFKTPNYFQQSIVNSSATVSFKFSGRENGEGGSDEKDSTCNEQNPDSDDEEAEDSSSHCESLRASATRYAKDHEAKLRLEREVEHVTGEEGESHVLHVFCKLHVFDKERRSWSERGRGTLKLNDICRSETQGIFQSRLVFRTQGANAVQLNTMLWPDMCCESVNDKTVRITAIDPDTKEAKVFLITTNKKDAMRIVNAVSGRIEALKRNQDSCSSPSSVADEPNDDSNDVGAQAEPGEDEDSCSDDLNHAGEATRRNEK